MHKKCCFIVSVLTAVLLNGVASAEEDETLRVSAKLLMGHVIDQTLPLQSDEDIHVQLDIQGLRTRDSYVAYEMSVVLKCNGSVVEKYTRQLNPYYCSSETCNQFYVVNFDPQMPGKYIADVTITSRYNEKPASCQLPFEIVDCNSLHLRGLTFVAAPNLPMYPIFPDNDSITLAGVMPRNVSADNALTIDIFIDDETKPLINNHIRSNIQSKILYWTFAVTTPGRHKVTVKVRDSQGQSIQYVMPFFVVPDSELKGGMQKIPAE